MSGKLPFSQACENNKQPILQVLQDAFKSSRTVLEIGSGTGQHSVHMAAGLPHLEWYTSDQPHYHDGINARLSTSPLSNLYPPSAFTVGVDCWPLAVDAVFTANTTHIMQPGEAKLMMNMVATNLPPGGVFCQYGPFNVDGRYTSSSNAAFDASLKQRGCGGIQDIATLRLWTEANGLHLFKRHLMPANNLLLEWHKA